MLAGLSIFGGVVLLAIPDAASGFMDQPDFVVLVVQRDGVETLNLISMLGSFGIFAGFGLVLVAVVMSFLFFVEDDEDVDDNNLWGGHMLEWLTASPPEPGNFPGTYVVTSEAPLLDDDFVNPYAEANA